MRVAVIGAGAIGSHSAWQLARAGVDTVVFDRFQAPNSWGAHDGESRLLRSIPYLETAPGDREILADSTEAWRDLQSRSQRSIVNECGGLIIDRADSPAFMLASEVASTQSTAHLLDQKSLNAEFPQFRVDASDRAVLDDLGGLADPQEAVAAALELAEAYGAELRRETRVVAMNVRDERVEIEVGGGDFEAFDRVVLATGAFARELVPQLPIRARRLLLGWFPPRAGSEHLVTDMPSFVWMPAGGSFLYGGPAEGGSTIKVGMDWAWGETPNVMQGREVTNHDTHAMRALIHARLPWLDADLGRYEMHIDGWSADERGILGPLPTSPNVVLATGWSGHGFKISPVIGRIVASLICGEDSGYDISHLEPARFSGLRVS